MNNAPTTQTSRTTPSSWRRVFTVLPGLGATLLPVGACPACWPGYAGFLSAAGLGFLFDSAYLLPIAALLLTFALASLAYRASRRRGYAPFGLGTLGAALALWGKFGLTSDLLLYVGLAVLTVASLWNAWPRRATTASTCASCAPQVRRSKTEAHKLEVEA
jgi:mercuric ion transport protein